MSDPLPPAGPDQPAPPAGAASPADPPPALDPGKPDDPAPSLDPASPPDPAPTLDPAPPAEPAAPAPPAARPYTAPPLDAPQYAIPAYAAPEPSDSEAPPSPAAAPGGHPYTTPAYAAAAGTAVGAAPAAAPGSVPATPGGPYAAPGGPYAAPGLYAAGPGAEAHSTTTGALPPYARNPATPPPFFPGGPAFGPAPAGAGLPPGGADSRPKALAITALVLAGAGVLVVLVAATLGTLGLGWLSPLLLFTAFVLSLIALISRKQGGKGFGVGALVLSILGGILTMVVAVAWIFGSFGTSYGGDADSDWDDGYEDYVLPGLAAPGTDGEPDPGAQFAPPVPLTVSETAFGHDYDDVWWYALVVDNPNADYVYDAYLNVHAYAADGAALGSTTAYATMLSGETAFVGYFFDVGDAEIARIEVDVPEASQATLSPSNETGTFVVEGLTAAASSGGAVAATGTVSAHFADDQEYVAVTVLARAADGTITAASSTYVDALPGDGTPVPFEAWFGELPADATLEAFAHR